MEGINGKQSLGNMGLTKKSINIFQISYNHEEEFSLSPKVSVTLL
jgi:hypothetical protein